MLKEIILMVFIFNKVKTQCLPLEYDTHSRLFSVPDLSFSPILEVNNGGVLLRNNGFEEDFMSPCHTTITETPVLIYLDPVSDTIFLGSYPSIQETDLKRCEAYPNTYIMTITETLLIDIPDDGHNGMFFGCDGFPQTTFIDLEYLSKPEKSIFDSCSIPPLPPVLGRGKYLRQVTIQPPFF